MLSLSTPEYAVRRMVRAISSAMARSVLLEELERDRDRAAGRSSWLSSSPTSRAAFGASSRSHVGGLMRGAPSSMTMLPKSSSAARASGGTTHVASYSSTMHGSRRVRRRGRRGSGSAWPVQPRSGAEVDAARALGEHGVRPVDAHALGHARPVGDALRHHPQADQLHRLVRAGPVPVGALVLAAEGLGQLADAPAASIAPGGAGTVSSNDWPW